MTFDGLHIMLTLLAIGLLMLVIISIRVRNRMEAYLKSELHFAHERARYAYQLRDAARDHSAQLAKELQHARQTPHTVVLGGSGRIVPVGAAPLPSAAIASNSSNAPSSVTSVHHDTGVMSGALLGAATAASFHRLYANSDSVSVASDTSSSSYSSSSSDGGSSSSSD
jgi:hypothetical protein